jgi:adenosylmethionine-8-amino-7-oxononanoate aminotransferase
MIWPPFTPLAWADERLPVKAASGNKLTLEDGRQILDAISSWWTNLHGHGHPVLVEAISKQAAMLDHVIFAGFTHEPAEKLAQLLCEAVPMQTPRLFYSDNGSTAVEVAVKIALQYWQILGALKTRLIAFDGAYHGDTFGAMAAGARGLFTGPFESFLFNVDRFPFPETWPSDNDSENKASKTLLALESHLESHAGETAALIIEPLVQGAGGMRMCSEPFLQKLVALCNRFGVLVIFDEVMTGFGRTGAIFAAEKAGVRPDLMALSKGITGGLVPLGATLIAKNVWDAFDSASYERTFFHGHSYAGNPVACAAGVASWRLLQNAGGRIAAITAFQSEAAKMLEQRFPGCRARSCGTILALEADGSSPDYRKPLSKWMREAFLEKGILLRPLGNTIYVLPPYCTTENEFHTILSAIEKIVHQVRSGNAG